MESLRDAEGELRKSARAERDNAQQHRAAAAEAGEKAAKAECEAERFQQLLDEAAKERGRLVSIGAMMAEETAPGAQHRMEQSIAQSQQTLDTTRRDLEGRHAEQRAVRERRQTAGIRLAEVRKDHGQVENTCREAERRRQSLRATQRFCDSWKPPR